MAPSSELGPVDPQISLREDGGRKYYSAFNLVNGYRKLFAEAVATKGSLEPYIQQLARYDDREISKYESWIGLSKNVAINVLSTGMMQSLSISEIENKIAVFLEPAAGTYDHDRAISGKEALACGLNVELLDLKSKEWRCIYEHYFRSDAYTSGRASKLFESEAEWFYETRPKA
jgi:hypothetical protein